METQNQGRVETLFPALCFQSFWRFYYLDIMGAMLPYPQSWAYCNQWSDSGDKLFLLVELKFLLASGSWFILK